MTATSIFIRINVWLKLTIHLTTIISYILINSPPASMLETLKKFVETPGLNWTILDHKQEFSHLFYIIMIAIILHLIDRQVEYILSLNIQWNEQLESDRVESQTVGQINRILLENILPPHVLKRYLYNTAVSYDQLYHESVSTIQRKQLNILVDFRLNHVGQSKREGQLRPIDAVDRPMERLSYIARLYEWV